MYSFLIASILITVLGFDFKPVLYINAYRLHTIVNNVRKQRSNPFTRNKLKFALVVRYKEIEVPTRLNSKISLKSKLNKKQQSTYLKYKQEINNTKILFPSRLSGTMHFIKIIESTRYFKFSINRKYCIQLFFPRFVHNVLDKQIFPYIPVLFIQIEICRDIIHIEIFSLQ